MKRTIPSIIEIVSLDRLFRKYRNYSMIKRRGFIENLLLAKRALENPALQDGAIIECGTWKGGMAAALVELGGPDRSYYFFDSFEGLPPADEAKDGAWAIAYQAGNTDLEYQDNCSASLSDFTDAISKTGSNANIIVKKGFFEKTLPDIDPPPIAVLRLDADWYSSTMECLQKFWPRVLPGGLILIDDYYVWEGCSRAIHEFLTAEKAIERIQQGWIAGTAHISKGGP